VNLHLPALPAGVVLQPSSYRLEGIVDHDVDVLVLWICFKVRLPFFFVAESDGGMLRNVICTGRIMLCLLLLTAPSSSRPDNDDEFMPGWLKTLTHLNPLTYVLDAIRTFMLAGSTSATRIKPRSENNKKNELNHQAICVAGHLLRAATKV
jgi:hypothetical protein